MLHFTAWVWNTALKAVDKAEIKKLLQSFREGTEDTNDPVFSEALARLASDPELTAWFRAEQEFDAVMVETFRSVPVVSSLKERILQGA